jgi:PKD domain
VRNFARSSARPAGAETRRRSARLPLAAAVVALLSLLACAPAGAIVTTVGGTSVGLQPRTSTLGEGNPATFANDTGSVILNGTSVYAVYWDPTNVFHTHHEWLTKIDAFMQQMGANSGALDTIFAPLGQYRDRSNKQATYNTVFKGAYSDTGKYPGALCADPHALLVGAITCLTDAQLRAELQSFIAARGLPTGMNTVYYLITPPGVTVCLDAGSTHCSDFSVSGGEESKGERKSESYKNSFCSYHGYINPNNAVQGDRSTIIYAAVPWTSGTQGNGFQIASSGFYAQGYDCQDGGWSAEKNEENFEKTKEPSAEQKEILEGKKGNAEEKAALESARRLEGPHIQEPNQEPEEGKGEAGDQSAGLADLIVNQIAQEQANIVTDPLLASWQDGTGHEVTDVCRNHFASTAGKTVGGSAAAIGKTEAGTLYNQSLSATNYYINNVFSLSGGDCVGGVGMVPRFTAPNPVNAHEVVGFDGIESTLALLEGKAFGPSGPPTPTFATFAWSFGDGTEARGYAPDAPTCEAPWLSPCAGSIFHSYAYGGTYKVTLTVTDVAGNVSSVMHEVIVNGPAAPAAAGGAGTGAGAGTPGATGTGAGAGAAGPGKPVASAALTSHSLKRALRKGLSVSYSVNEQVAGHFEVLIARSLARRLKLGGAAATGLPAGTPPQLQIAKALLVTTKGGSSVIVISFSKLVAAKLAHAHSVPLLLRLIVRNGSVSNPTSTTVLSSVTLSG